MNFVCVCWVDNVSFLFDSSVARCVCVSSCAQPTTTKTGRTAVLWNRNEKKKKKKHEKPQKKDTRTRILADDDVFLFLFTNVILSFFIRRHLGLFFLEGEGVWSADWPHGQPMKWWKTNPKQTDSQWENDQDSLALVCRFSEDDDDSADDDDDYNDDDDNNNDHDDSRPLHTLSMLCSVDFQMQRSHSVVCSGTKTLETQVPSFLQVVDSFVKYDSSSSSGMESSLVFKVILQIVSFKSESRVE